MGNILSNESYDYECYQVKDSDVVTLVKHFAVLTEIISYSEGIIDGDLYESMRTYPTHFLVDVKKLMNYPLSDTYRNHFFPTKDIVVGVQQRNPVVQKFNIYDSYNNFFIVEQRNYKTKDELLTRVKSMDEALRNLRMNILNTLANLCSKNVGLHDSTGVQAEQMPVLE